MPYKKLVKELIAKCFEKVRIKNVPRNNNKFIDIMTNVASLKPIPIEEEETIMNIKILKKPSHMLEFIHNEKILSCFLVHHDEWYKDIYVHLEDGISHEEHKNKFQNTRLKKETPRYVQLGMLYMEDILKVHYPGVCSNKRLKG